jgi:pimeloyl-ACP methyl ester carboxylesterase
MPHAKVNGIDIWYEVIGADRPGLPIVLTHGFAGPSGHWKPEVVSFAQKRPLVMYDVRGHGRSSVLPDEASYSMPQFAADLAGLLRQIGIERAHIGGVSMGGMVTAQFAVDHPEMCESVLLCDTTCGNGKDPGPAGDWERRMQEGIGTLRHFVQEFGLEETVKREFEYRVENDPHQIENPYPLDGEIGRIKMMTVPGYLGASQAMLTRADLTGAIPSITAPTLVMIGAWDDFLPCAMRDHGLIAGSRLVVRERCGHGSRWRAETFIAEVESFLGDVESGGPIAFERYV